MLLSSFLQSGGLKQKKHHSPTSGKQKAKSPLQAIEDMLKSPSATFEVLTCSSLKGFMFTLTVLPEHSEFFKQLRPGGKFDVPETEFIVKFCITSDDEYGIDAFKFPPTVKKGVDKETESAEGFFEEAKLQQNIWRHSISAGKEPLCPSVAAFQILEHSRALTFLSGLSPAVGKTKSAAASVAASTASASHSLCTTPKSQYTIDFLFKQIRKVSGSSSSGTRFDLGILLMSKIPNSTTLEAYLEMHSGTEKSHLDARHHVKCMMLAKVIRLFIEGKAVHFDFHPGNGMVILDPPSGDLEGTIVIDFGRASSLQNPNADGYLNPAEKQQFLALIDGPPGARSMSSRSASGPQVGVGYYDECLHYCLQGSTPAQKAGYLSKVLKVIIDVEHAKSQAKFHDPKDPTGYPKERYQTKWVEELFEHGQTRATPTGFSIQQRWAEVTFGELCRTLVVSAESASSCSALGDMCLQFKPKDSAATYTTSGGAKTSSKKSRKSKKTRKQRKSRKIRRSRKSKR
jgi:hypothetical protein